MFIPNKIILTPPTDEYKYAEQPYDGLNDLSEILPYIPKGTISFLTYEEDIDKMYKRLRLREIELIKEHYKNLPSLEILVKEPNQSPLGSFYSHYLFIDYPCREAYLEPNSELSFLSYYVLSKINDVDERKREEHPPNYLKSNDSSERRALNEGITKFEIEEALVCSRMGQWTDYDSSIIRTGLAKGIAKIWMEIDKNLMFSTISKPKIYIKTFEIVPASEFVSEYFLKQNEERKKWGLRFYNRKPSLNYYANITALAYK